jgi:hypothetical protein
MFLRNIVGGPLWNELSSEWLRSGAGSVVLYTAPFHPGAAFIRKGSVGRYARAVSRSGLVLWMARHPSVAVADENLQALRISIWHRATMLGMVPAPYGILMVTGLPAAGDFHAMARHPVLGEAPQQGADLWLDLGGGRVLSFLPRPRRQYCT